MFALLCMAVAMAEAHYPGIVNSASEFQRVKGSDLRRPVVYVVRQHPRPKNSTHHPLFVCSQSEFQR
jgi:hypothetical protein